MAVFLPLRASCLVSRWQISANRTLSVMRAFKTSDEDLRSQQKPLSTQLQVFLKKPVVDKEILKNYHFFHLLRAQLDIILNKNTESLLKSLENGDLGVNEFDKIAARIGLRRLSTDEIGQFFPKRSSFYPYLTCDQEIKQINVYVSSKDVIPQKKNIFLFGVFANHHKYDKVVILLKNSKEKVVLKCFMNLPANDTLAILPGSRVQGNVPYKLLLSTLVGLSLGSATSAAISKILYLSSGALINLTAASIFASTYVWGKWKDSQSSILLDKCWTLNECGFVSGSVMLQLVKNEIASKLFLEVLVVYSFLVRERDNNMEKGETSERLIVDDYFLRKFKKFTSEELDFEPAKDFSFDETVRLMESLEMVRRGDGSYYLDVTPFKELLSNLENKELSFSDRFDLQC